MLCSPSGADHSGGRPGLLPPYYAVNFVNADLIQSDPALAEVLSKLDGAIDEATMAAMNAQVDVDGMSAKEVAHQFLVDNGLIPPDRPLSTDLLPEYPFGVFRDHFINWIDKGGTVWYNISRRWDFGGTAARLSKICPSLLSAPCCFPYP